MKRRINILEGDFNDLVAKAKAEGSTHYEALNGGHVAMWGLWRDVDGEEPHYALLMKAVGREGYLLSGWAGKSRDEMEPDLEPIAELRAPPSPPHPWGPW